MYVYAFQSQYDVYYIPPFNIDFYLLTKKYGFIVWKHIQTNSKTCNFKTVKKLRFVIDIGTYKKVKEYDHTKFPDWLKNRLSNNHVS